MCGIIGVFKHEGEANVEIYEGLLMLQHRGQDSGAQCSAVRWGLCAVHGMHACMTRMHGTHCGGGQWAGRGDGLPAAALQQLCRHSGVARPRLCPACLPGLPACLVCPIHIAACTPPACLLALPCLLLLPACLQRAW